MCWVHWYCTLTSTVYSNTHTNLLVEFNHPSDEASIEGWVEGVGNGEQILGGEGLHVYLRGRGGERRGGRERVWGGEGRGGEVRGGEVRGGEVSIIHTVMCEDLEDIHHSQNSSLHYSDKHTPWRSG